jgi:hypothetical protein
VRNQWRIALLHDELAGKAAVLVGHSTTRKRTSPMAGARLQGGVMKLGMHLSAATN